MGGRPCSKGFFESVRAAQYVVIIFAPCRRNRNVVVGAILQTTIYVGFSSKSISSLFAFPSFMAREISMPLPHCHAY